MDHYDRLHGALIIQKSQRGHNSRVEGHRRQEAALLIESIQRDARTRPGPDAYHPQPTFAQELQMRRYRKAIVAGDVAPSR